MYLVELSKRRVTGSCTFESALESYSLELLGTREVLEWGLFNRPNFQDALRVMLFSFLNNCEQLEAQIRQVFCFCLSISSFFSSTSENLCKNEMKNANTTHTYTYTYIENKKLTIYIYMYIYIYIYI
eukprot:gene12995-8841_t